MHNWCGKGRKCGLKTFTDKSEAYICIHSPWLKVVGPPFGAVTAASHLGHVSTHVAANWHWDFCAFAFIKWFIAVV